jgi:hypothetical protein
VKARRSPVAIGIVLGLLVGAGAATAIALTSSGSESSASPPKVTIAPRVAVSPTTATTTGGPLNEPQTLPQLTGEAQGYRLGSQPAPGAIERLAASFDMHAPVQTDSGGWVVHDGNRLLRVQRGAGLPWFFSLLDGACKLVPGSPPPSAATGTLQTVPPSGPTDCPDATPPEATPDLVVSHDDALSFGMETLGRAGLGVSRPVIVEEPGGWYIEASPLVGTLPTAGLPWTITVGPGATASAASGYLARPVRADTYRLVGVAQGLVRARQVADGGTVTGVRLGLMLGHVGSAPYLVPAYLFELDGGGGPPPIVPVPAIEDRYLS